MFICSQFHTTNRIPNLGCQHLPKSALLEQVILPVVVVCSMAQWLSSLNLMPPQEALPDSILCAGNNQVYLCHEVLINHCH